MDAVLAFAQAPDGTMLFHDDRQNTVRAYRPSTNTRSDPLPQFNIPAEAIHFDRDGALWLAGDGVSRVPFPNRLSARVSQSSTEVERFTEEEGLTENVAQAILEDREGNIWLGTGGGLDRFRFRNVLWFPFPSGTTHFSLIAGDNGEVWAGSNGATPWPIARVTDAKPVKGAKTTAQASIQRFLLTASRDTSVCKACGNARNASAVNSLSPALPNTERRL